MKSNILFLVIDSFRSDKCYNKNKTSVTPNIDSLIKRSNQIDSEILNEKKGIDKIKF